jgi:hypothetical protein
MRGEDGESSGEAEKEKKREMTEPNRKWKEKTRRDVMDPQHWRIKLHILIEDCTKTHLLYQAHNSWSSPQLKEILWPVIVGLSLSSLTAPDILPNSAWKNFSLPKVGHVVTKLLIEHLLKILWAICKPTAIANLLQVGWKLAKTLLKRCYNNKLC